jgi:histone H4
VRLFLLPSILFLHSHCRDGPKRHRIILRSQYHKAGPHPFISFNLSVSFKTLSFQAIRCISRRGGVKRISGLIYEDTRGILKIFLENVWTSRHVLQDCGALQTRLRIPRMQRGSPCCLSVRERHLLGVRKTVTALDVVYALKRSGRTVYGFGA